MSIGKVIETLETEIREYRRMIDEHTLCLAGESAYEECQSRIDFDREIIALLRTHPDAQPNEPLTLEELQDMVGQPVWVESPGVDRGISGRWAIVDAVSMEERALYTRGDYTCRIYGVVWVAYRRPPKEA